MNFPTVPITPEPSRDERAPRSTRTQSACAEDGTGAPRMRLDLYDNSDFDRGASRLKEGLWMLCKCLFFLNPFPWPSRLRVALLRVFGARVGSGMVIRSGVNVTFPWRLTVGDHVWIGEEVLILSLAQVSIGSNVCVSQRAFLCTGSHAWRREAFDLITRPITVEERVWISAQAFIGPGVAIGSGSIVSAGAVLMRGAPAGSFVRGNPAIVSSISSPEPTQHTPTEVEA